MADSASAVVERNNMKNPFQVKNVENMEINEIGSAKMIPITTTSTSTTNKRKLDPINQTEKIAKIDKTNNDVDDTPGLVPRYGIFDKGPYYVYIEAKEENVNLIHLASLLKSYNITDIINITSINKKKAKIHSSNYKSSNKIIDEPKLKNLGYEAFIPKNFISCIGVINNVLPKQDLEQLKNNISSINDGILIVESVVRITKWNHKEKTAEDTNSIMITFRGQSLPSEIRIYGVINKVRFYQRKPMQCRNCLKFGHPSARCKDDKLCMRCGKNNHNVSDCVSEPTCVNCNGKHRSNDRDCPVVINQQLISNVMTKYKLTYREAALKMKDEGNFENFPAIGNKRQNNQEMVQAANFAEIVKMRKQMETLIEDNKKKDAIIEDLTSKVTMLIATIESMKKDEPASSKQQHKKQNKIAEQHDEDKDEKQNKQNITNPTNQPRTSISYDDVISSRSTQLHAEWYKKTLN